MAGALAKKKFYSKKEILAGLRDENDREFKISKAKKGG